MDLHVCRDQIKCINFLKRMNDHHCIMLNDFLQVTCSLSMQGMGVVVRIAATTTDSVYKFLQNQLAGMEQLIGVSPYC